MITKNFTLLAVVTASLLGSQLHAAEQQRPVHFPIYDLAADTTGPIEQSNADLSNEDHNDNTMDRNDLIAGNIAYLQHQGCTPMSEEELRQYHGEPVNVVITSGPNAGALVRTDAVAQWDRECAENEHRNENLQIALQRNAAIANAVVAAGTELSVLAHQGLLGLNAATREVRQWRRAHPMAAAGIFWGAYYGAWYALGASIIGPRAMNRITYEVVRAIVRR